MFQLQIFLCFLFRSFPVDQLEKKWLSHCFWTVSALPCLRDCGDWQSNEMAVETVEVQSVKFRKIVSEYPLTNCALRRPQFPRLQGRKFSLFVNTSRFANPVLSWWGFNKLGQNLGVLIHRCPGEREKVPIPRYALTFRFRPASIFPQGVSSLQLKITLLLQCSLQLVTYGFSLSNRGIE